MVWTQEIENRIGNYLSGRRIALAALSGVLDDPGRPVSHRTYANVLWAEIRIFPSSKDIPMHVVGRTANNGFITSVGIRLVNGKVGFR